MEKRDRFFIGGINKAGESFCSSCQNTTPTIKFKNSALCRDCSHLKGIFAGGN